MSKGLFGNRLGRLLTWLAILGVGIIYAFIQNVAMTLIVIIFVPFIILAFFLDIKFQDDFYDKEHDIIEEAGKVKKTHTHVLKHLLIKLNEGESLNVSLSDFFLYDA